MILRARRLVFAFAAILFLALGGLAGRIAWVQATNVEDAQLRMFTQSSRWSTKPAIRGRILDRFGSPLALSVPQLQLAAYGPNFTGPPGGRKSDARITALVDRTAGFLAPRLARPRADISRRLTTGGYSRLGAPIVDPDLMDELEAAQGRRGALALVDFEYGWARRHPGNTVAGNVVGFLDHEGHGVAGVERGLHDLLVGIEGQRFHRVDVHGAPIHHPDDSVIAKVAGSDVRLTIDTRLQGKVERILAAAVAERDADGAACAVMDVFTGDLLTLASVPLFDAGDRRVRDKNRYRHRAVEDIYAPGSIMKPLMMAAALELGLVTPDSRIDCRADRGHFPRRSAMVKDTKPQDHPLNPREILVYSSNIGMARIFTSIMDGAGQKDPERMRPVYDVLRRLGLGQRTGIPLPYESGGVLSRLSRWSRDNTLVSVSHGYEMAVTVVQMAAAVGTLADGHRRTPRLLDAVQGSAGEWLEAARPAPVPVFRRDTCDLIRDWMVAVLDEGTSKMGLLDGVLVAGKTGTAQDERDHSKENHSFAALLPADAPRYSVVVLMQDPQGGRFSSQTTVPVAREILRELLAYEGLSR